MDKSFLKLCLAGALCAAGAASAQEVYRVSPIGTEWAMNSAEGQCRLRVWIDDRAQVRLHGDEVIVDTRAGRRSFDQGSVCSQPLPFHRVENFRVTLERGRGRVVDVNSPNQRNDFHGSVSVEDPQGGGDSYVLVMAWRNPDEFRRAPLAANVPLLDEARACQEHVRHQFIRNNEDSDAYLEFIGEADRDDAGPGRGRIRGEAWARSRTESRRVSYECLLNDRTNRVITASYDLLGPRRYGSLY
jgi:hypothetical protein